MKRTNVSIKFRDNNVSLNFDISKDTLFYGVNGRGKTRALKSIQLIHELAASNNHSRVIEILKELNLSELKIDGKSHDQIFKTKDKYVIADQENFKKLLTEEKKLILEYYKNSFDFLNYNSHFLNSFDQRRIQRSIEQLKNIISDSDVFKGNIIDFISILETQSMIARRIQRKYVSDDDFYFETEKFNSSDISVLNRYIDLNQHILSVARVHNYSLVKEKINLDKNFTQKIEDILKNLGNSSTVYISTEIEKETNILFERISLITNKINENLLDMFWNKKIKRIYSKEIIELKLKVDAFNEVMLKYENITISISLKGIISFYKNHTQIDFSRLSSGERRLCIIFMTMIFIEKDIYLIDEPEMSLSLNYQSKIVFDLLKLSESKVIMIATHAPFIFEDFSSIEGNQCIEV
jgi:hypothetical protein